jgi:hypothetical protein
LRSCEASAAPVAAADDPEAADQAVLEVDHVHRAAATAVRSDLTPEELREQRGLVDTDGDRGAVPAVGRRDRVAAPEHVADADGDRLLPLIEVRRSLDLVVQEQPVNGVLEQTDAEHPLVEALELGAHRRARRVRGLGRHSCLHSSVLSHGGTVVHSVRGYSSRWIVATRYRFSAKSR